MANLSFKNINKVYTGETYAVSDFNLEIKDEEFVVLIGPSGCGKSTLLRMIAGLEEITGGELYIDDELANNKEPKDRDIAMVFQNYALYPHKSVFENMAFGLKMRKVPKDEINKVVTETAKILGIEDLLNRKPRALSGGQKQRVVLGRAIVRKPKVFLMDEPLSNLDAKLRVQTRAEIVKLHKKLKTTFIYVTHDQTEAMTMGDRIVIMNNGRIQQQGSPRELYNKPSNKFVASFIGSPQMSFINVKVTTVGDKARLVNDDIDILLEDNLSSELKRLGYKEKDIILGIRPEDVIAFSDDPNSIEVTVDLVENLGSEQFIYFNIGKSNMTSKINEDVDIDFGEKLKVNIDLEKIHLFDKATENRII